MSLTQAEWLQKRKKYVTATEVASLVGLNPWQSAGQMWKEKTEGTFNGNAYTTIGTLLEPVVVELTNIALGRQFKLYDTSEGHKTFFTNEELRLGATPDACDETTILECKTTKPVNLVRYAGQAPTQYVAQVMVQLMLEKKHDAYISLMSTDLTQTSPTLRLPLVIYYVKKSPLLIALIEQEVQRFWQCVEEGRAFRVDSRVKKAAKIACLTCTERVR